MVEKSQKNIQSQLLRFQKAARELECDEDERAFDENLGNLAKQKPAPSKDDTSSKG